MNYYNGISKEDREEIISDRCAAYQAGIISERDFRTELGRLGFNATDIEELVRFYRPEPDGEDYGESH